MTQNIHNFNSWSTIKKFAYTHPLTNSLMNTGSPEYRTNPPLFHYTLINNFLIINTIYT